MSDLSFYGDGCSGGGSGGGMSDGDEFDAPAATPPKARRARFTFKWSGHCLTPGCALLLVDGTVRQPPGSILDTYEGLCDQSLHFSNFNGYWRRCILQMVFDRRKGPRQ